MERKTKMVNQKSGYNQMTSKKEPILSVIIPAYNLENDIVLCLDSVLKQNVAEMEILVVDDCSQDGTAEVLRRYKEKDLRVKPIYLKENSMPSGARNVALDVAKGEYIHFCDGDDMVPEGAYEELLRIAEEENADIVTGNYSRKYPSEGNVIRQFSHYQAKDPFARCFESGNITLWNKIFRRSIIEKRHIRFSKELRYHEDMMFYMKIMEQNPIAAYTDKSIYIYTEPYDNPDCDETIKGARYACVRCTEDTTRVYRHVFAQSADHHDEIWFECYSHNIEWLMQNSWRWLENPKERKEAFELIQNALLDVQETATACDWTKGNHMQRFIEIFGTDFSTFVSMCFEDYMYLFYQRQSIIPRSTDQRNMRGMEYMRGAERDQALALGMEQVMEDIQRIYSRKITVAAPVWKNNYFNLLDSALNDYWRQIASHELKEKMYTQLQDFVSRMRMENSLCLINTENDIHRFEQIFCLDYAAFQVLSYSQYMLLCTTNTRASGGGGGGCYMPQPLEFYVAACQNGQIGMRGILKGIKAWFRFKLRR